MNAVFQKPPVGTPLPIPPPGGIKGKPPGGFVYPYWLPQIPGTITVKPKVVDPPHYCPESDLTADRNMTNYYGSGYDDSISLKIITGKSLRDCEVKNCHLDNCTVTDCLLVSCTVNRGRLTDVEMRNTQVFDATVHDVKCIGDCRLGKCQVSEGDLNTSSFHKTNIKSSEVKACKAWDTAFDDCTIKNISSYTGCTYENCGGDVPKTAPKPTPAPQPPVVNYNQVVPKEQDCPSQPLSKPNKPNFTGSRNDNVIKGHCIIGQSLTDCEVRDCYLEGATVNDCLLVDCHVNNGTYKDAELRGCQLFKADLDDIKALDGCKFGECTINNAELQSCHYSLCTVTSSAATNGVAWDTKFRDATITNVKYFGKCKFALCGGDIPKKDDSSDDEELGAMPGAYNPNQPGGTAAAAAAPPATANPYPPTGYTYSAPPVAAPAPTVQPEYQQPSYAPADAATPAPQQQGYALPQYTYPAPPTDL